MIDLSVKPAHGGHAIHQFDAIDRQLIDEWERRKGLPDTPSPAETATGYIKREAYRIIIHYWTNGHGSLFERVVRRDGRALTSRVRLDENPFHFGLLALFSDDSIVSRQDRSVFAMQMLYAYHHGVPPTFLIGFLYQAGSKEEIRRKLAAGTIEPGFEATHKRYIKDVRIGSFR